MTTTITIFQNALREHLAELGYETETITPNEFQFYYGVYRIHITVLPDSYVIKMWLFVQRIPTYDPNSFEQVFEFIRDKMEIFKTIEQYGKQVQSWDNTQTTP